ncbi:unnamed protein product [Plutella xylostella]|uniref:(diamondback moth) hypothetical protein n=1 Tax=Plutella xylostella TaxID=51655 RepID=A0A8S4D8L4_PLUXY|nr:unnamed protein product [Plutella xylostella]
MSPSTVALLLVATSALAAPPSPPEWVRDGIKRNYPDVQVAAVDTAGTFDAYNGGETRKYDKVAECTLDIQENCKNTCYWGGMDGMCAVQDGEIW